MYNRNDMLGVAQMTSWVVTALRERHGIVLDTLGGRIESAALDIIVESFMAGMVDRYLVAMRIAKLAVT